MRAFILRRVSLIARGWGDVVLVGSQYSPSTLRLREFLTRNGHPHTYLDVERDADVEATARTLHVGVDDIPVIICRGELVLRNPTFEQVADCLGFNAAIDVGAVRDLLVVGAGPAGLAAAVYGASEGLDVLVLESHAPGGQAGSSSKIENYLGFPTGISGQALAGRAFSQAEKFGANVAIARSAAKLLCEQRPFAVRALHGRRGARARGRHRVRRAVPQAAARAAVALRGRRRLLRGDADGGAGVRRRGGDRRRRRQLRGPGRGLPRRDRRSTCTCSCAPTASPPACRAT